MFLFLTYYFQENLGYSALKTGFAFLPFSVGIILAAGVCQDHPPDRSEVGDGGRIFGGHAGHAVADPDRRPHLVRGPRAAGRDPHQPGHGTRLRPHEQHRPLRSPRPRCRCGAATLNTTQQIGGSLGTALLNTVFASTTAAYLATRVGTPAVREAAQIHGYTVGFAIGAAFLFVAALSSAFLISAKREDMAELDTLALAPA